MEDRYLLKVLLQILSSLKLLEFTKINIYFVEFFLIRTLWNISNVIKFSEKCKSYIYFLKLKN